MSEVIQRMFDNEQKLWLPDGRELTVGQARVQRAIEEYDERLVLARHEITGDWVIFIKVEHGNLYPVIGLGRELPEHPEDVTRRLYEADAARHGTKLLDQVNRHNEEIRKASRDAADEAIGQTAEQLEWGYRQEGWHPSPRIFVP